MMRNIGSQKYRQWPLFTAILKSILVYLCDSYLGKNIRQHYEQDKREIGITAGRAECAAQIG